EKLEIEDVKVQRHYCTIGYGLTDTWQLDFMLGGADIKQENKFEGEDEWFGTNFDTGFAWGVGTRITLSENDSIKWGVSAQVNSLDSEIEEKYDDAGNPTKQTGNFESYDLLVAFGPKVDMGGWKLYGGPFYHILDGELDVKENVEGVEADTAKANADLEQDGFGGFIGVQFNIYEGVDLTTEYSATSDGWAASLGIAWTF
ncbi:MAG: outer membrane beta-barrel protein, partial [Planctomycetota bacterium]